MIRFLVLSLCTIEIYWRAAHLLVIRRVYPKRYSCFCPQFLPSFFFFFLKLAGYRTVTLSYLLSSTHSYQIAPIQLSFGRLWLGWGVRRRWSSKNKKCRLNHLMYHDLIIHLPQSKPLSTSLIHCNKGTESLHANTIRTKPNKSLSSLPASPHLTSLLHPLNLLPI